MLQELLVTYLGKDVTGLLGIIVVMTCIVLSFTWLFKLK